MKSIYVAITALGLLSACVIPVPVASVDADTTIPQSNNFMELINGTRASAGLAPLMRDSRLDRAAQRHAEDMNANSFMNHRGSDGSSHLARANAAGWGSCLLAENIATGQASEASVFRGWMGSAGHRFNILQPRMRKYGLGSSGGAYVLMLGGNC